MSAVFDHSEDFDLPAAEQAGAKTNARTTTTRGNGTMSIVSSGRSRARRSAQTEYRLIAALTFPVFLVIAALSFVLPRQWRVRLGLDVEGSLFARTRSLAGTSIPFVFMG
jgi:hypothetical protein